MKAAIAEFFDAFPCNLIGHRWREVPRSFRGRQTTMRFQCSRCHRIGGFTN